MSGSSLCSWMICIRCLRPQIVPAANDAGKFSLPSAQRCSMFVLDALQKEIAECRVQPRMQPFERTGARSRSVELARAARAPARGGALRLSCEIAALERRSAPRPKMMLQTLEKIKSAPGDAMTPQASDPQYLAPVAPLRSTRSRGSRRQARSAGASKQNRRMAVPPSSSRGALCWASKDARWPSPHRSKAASRAHGGTRARRRAGWLGSYGSAGNDAAKA